jgi:ribonuclease III family protein
VNGLTYAYIGDAYYELAIRKHLVSKGHTAVNDLHTRAVNYTSGAAQAYVIDHLIKESLINEDEIAMVKRGRNASGPGRKNIDARTYHMSTGFEALIGHLCLTDTDRANAVIQMAITTIERRRHDGEDRHQQHPDDTRD